MVEWTLPLVAIVLLDAVALVLIWGVIVGWLPSPLFWIGVIAGVVGSWAFTKYKGWD